jgi:hypothetical protein
MASSPYNSEVLRFFVRQTHRLKAQAGHTWRWAKVATIWSAQVVGATAQGVWQWTRQGWRLAQPTLQAGAAALLNLTREMLSARSTPATLTADAPIRHILAAAQVAEIANPAPEPLPTIDAAPSSRGPTGTSAKRFPWQPLRAFQRNFLRWMPLRQWRFLQSPTAQLSPRGAASPVTAPQGAQGIASDLATGRLAWVTAQDIIVLEEAAHAMLAQHIDTELVDYDRHQRRLQRRQPLTTWSQQTVTHLQAWIWQAIVYFFGNPENQSSALPNGQQTRTLAHRNQQRHVQPWAATLGQPGQAMVLPLEALKSSPIYRWLRQAFDYFFGPPQSASLAGRSFDADMGALSPVGSSSFSLVLLPGLVELGQSIGSWLKRALQRLFPAVRAVPHEEILLREPAVLNQSPILSQSPLTMASMLPRSQPVMVGIGNVAMTTPSAAGISETWIEVPATLVGYGRSPLVVLLTGLDWFLTQLERAVVWLWRQVRLWTRIARWAWSNQNPSTVHLFSAIPNQSRGNVTLVPETCPERQKVRR